MSLECLKEWPFTEAKLFGNGHYFWEEAEGGGCCYKMVGGGEMNISCSYQVRKMTLNL